MDLSGSRLGSKRPFQVIRVVFTVCRRLPVYSGEQTSWSRSARLKSANNRMRT